MCPLRTPLTADRWVTSSAVPDVIEFSLVEQVAQGMCHNESGDLGDAQMDDEDVGLTFPSFVPDLAREFTIGPHDTCLVEDSCSGHRLIDVGPADDVAGEGTLPASAAARNDEGSGCCGPSGQPQPPPRAKATRLRAGQLRPREA